MESGRASKTALGVAIRRAAHQMIDKPPVLDDPIALRLVGDGYPRLMERAMHSVGRDFRGFMAARSRYTEDQLAEAVACGVTQYVVLGAGLDTFAYRNPFSTLRVFEVDFPATQVWKRAMLAQAAIALPANLVFVALDFEHQTLADGLVEAGLDFTKRAFFGWLGVVPYLTLDAFRATLSVVARMPVGSAVTFDYAVAPETLSPIGRIAFDRLSERVAAAGEPFRLFFTPEDLEAELRREGFKRVEQVDSGRLNDLYFNDRADGLKLSPLGLGMLVTAGV
ncbi:class I SAM-dependent methyltransferase [Telmatobacter sp. DSM 110680]|uniref:S-adenosyl-L-methionine-dependent methyltransferase n=1 Tax=Telmatobacter sp. DSM 110680 TaxID=3036704 RepID=A0AAU7DN33_9BACT